MCAVLAFELAGRFNINPMSSAQSHAWPTGLEWLLPLFYFKLLVSHLPKEAPYRPAPGF